MLLCYVMHRHCNLVFIPLPQTILFSWTFLVSIHITDLLVQKIIKLFKKKKTLEACCGVFTLFKGRVFNNYRELLT